MIDALKRMIIREGAVILGFFLAAGMWFLWFRWVAPLCYELLARAIHDYSYLWDGSSAGLTMFAQSGALALLCLAAVWLVLRVLKRAWRCLTRADKKKKTGDTSSSFGGNMFREFVVFVAVLLISIGTLYFSHGEYSRLREKYFSEVVMKENGYGALSSREKAVARAQYESLGPREAVEDMFRDYGLRVRLVYYAQSTAFWALVWGYPLYLIVRFLSWAMRRLDE